jgi:hypothetical protein
VVVVGASVVVGAGGFVVVVGATVVVGLPAHFTLKTVVETRACVASDPLQVTLAV